MFLWSEDFDQETILEVIPSITQNMASKLKSFCEEACLRFEDVFSSMHKLGDSQNQFDFLCQAVADLTEKKLVKNWTILDWSIGN